jgi:hypothetical protein
MQRLCFFVQSVDKKRLRGFELHLGAQLFVLGNG